MKILCRRVSRERACAALRIKCLYL